MRKFFMFCCTILLNFFCFYSVNAEETRPKVSVIVPVYKVEPWIRECLDSLVNQTLKEIEIICVDDGSPDNCGTILNEYAASDPRIKIISHKYNLGIYKSRNSGLKNATGEYITFVDSDDYIEPFTYEIAYNHAKNGNVDIVQYGHKIFTEGDEIENSIDFSDSRVLTLEEFIGETWNNFVWDKLFKAEIIKNDDLKFLPIIPCDDTCFSYMVMLRAKKFKLLPGKFYNYRYRRDSVSRISSDDIFLGNYRMFRYICDDWSKHNLLNGQEFVLFPYLIHWCIGHYDLSLKHSCELLSCFNRNIYRPEVVDACPEPIKTYVRNLEYSALTKKNKLQNGTYIISSSLNDRKVLDIEGASTENKGNLQIYEKNNTDAQKFEIELDERGFYTIRAKCSGKMINVEGGNQKVGTNVQQQEENGSDAQRFYIIPQEGGDEFEIIAKCNLLLLDVTYGSTENGSNIQVWERNHTKAQKFKFIKVG